MLQHVARTSQTNTAVTAAEWGPGAPVHAGEHEGRIPRCQAMEKGIVYFLQRGVKTCPKLFCFEISTLDFKRSPSSEVCENKAPFFLLQTILPLVQVFGVLTTSAFGSSMPEQIQIIIFQDVKGLKFSGVHASHQCPPSHITRKCFPPLYEGVREACCSTSF